MCTLQIFDVKPFLWNNYLVAMLVHTYLCTYLCTDARVVFGKEMAYYLTGRLVTTEFLPRGYKHVILMRDPRKSIPSHYRVRAKKPSKGKISICMYVCKCTIGWTDKRVIVIHIDISQHVCCACVWTEWSDFHSTEVGFKQLYELHELLSTQTDQETIIIDSSDLLADPGILCQMLSNPFHPPN